MILRLIVWSMLICGFLQASSGRLAQARIKFDDQAYSDVLILLEPLLQSSEPEVLALAGHCEFELGNYLAAESYFKHLHDPTSLYRMVQIEDKLDNFSELEKYYREIKNPPDFIRYIFVRQLVLNGHYARALDELEKLASSPEYQDKAAYIKAVAWVHQGQFDKAHGVLAALSKSQNLELGQLAKLTNARLFYEQDQLPEAIAIYETLNYPEELALAQIRAGDLSHDLKKAQDYYKAAEGHITDKGLKSDVLVRQEKNDEARVYAKANTDQINAVKTKIISNDPALLQDAWIVQQPEARRLQALKKNLARSESQLHDTKLAYEIFRIHTIGHYESSDVQAEIANAKKNLEKLQVELQNLKDEFQTSLGRVVHEAMPVWLARLDERMGQSSGSSVQIGFSELSRLQKRIAQIEQVKAAELKQAEEAF